MKSRLFHWLAVLCLGAPVLFSPFQSLAEPAWLCPSYQIIEVTRSNYFTIGLGANSQVIHGLWTPSSHHVLWQSQGQFGRPAGTSFLVEGRSRESGPLGTGVTSDGRFASVTQSQGVPYFFRMRWWDGFQWVELFDPTPENIAYDQIRSPYSIRGINERGDIAFQYQLVHLTNNGYAAIGPRAGLWSGAANNWLPIFPEDTTRAYVLSMNRTGVTCGVYRAANAPTGTPFRGFTAAYGRTPVDFAPIGTIGGYSQTHGINDAGEIVGVTGSQNSGVRPFIFLPVAAYGLASGLHEIGPTMVGYTTANSLPATVARMWINNRGQALLQPYRSDYATNGFLWQRGQAWPLAQLADTAGYTNLGGASPWFHTFYPNYEDDNSDFIHSLRGFNDRGEVILQAMSANPGPNGLDAPLLLFRPKLIATLALDNEKTAPGATNKVRLRLQNAFISTLPAPGAPVLHWDGQGTPDILSGPTLVSTNASWLPGATNEWVWTFRFTNQTTGIFVAQGSAGTNNSTLGESAFLKVVDQADLWVRRTNDVVWKGNDNYFEVPLASQTRETALQPTETAAFNVRVQNDSERERELTVQAVASGDPGWLVTYTQGATDVSALITGAGLNVGTLASGAYVDLTVTLRGTNALDSGSRREIVFTGKALGATNTRDVVKVAAEVLNEINVNTTGDEADADLEDGVPDVDLVKPGLQTTLRCAIDFANRRPGKDLVTFDIESSGSVMISPTVALPQITEPLKIDGTTQPGSGHVGVSGLLAGAVDGLSLLTSNCVIRGLVINGFERAGILIQGGLSHTIIGNILGTDANGTTGLGNGVGLLMMNSLSNIVGGLVPDDRNIISANLTDGISLTNSSNIEIRANFVGTDPDGNGSLPNGQAGLLAQQVTGLAVGTPGLPSCLNSATAVIIRNLDVGHIVNCFVGLNASGNATLGGTVNGLQLEHSGSFQIGGSSRNVFGGIASNAITLLETTNTQVLGNYIGTDQTGNTSLPVGTGIVAERTHGLSLGSASDLTVICATQGADIRQLFSGLGLDVNSVINCHFGVGADGTSKVGNMINGLSVAYSDSVNIGGSSRNVFGGISSNAITLLETTNTQVLGNYIGTDQTGNASLPVGTGIVAEGGQNLTVGSDSFLSVICATNGAVFRQLSALGVDISSVVNCYFGVGADGTSKVGNMINGLSVAYSDSVNIGGSSRNVFGGISSNAITLLETTNTQVLGNYIGTDQTGNASLPVGTGIVAEKARNLAIGASNALSVISATNGAVLRELSGLSNTLNNCFFGLAANGTNQVGNMRNGLVSERSTGLNLGGISRNIFAFISSNAVTLQSVTNVQLSANWIGTDVTALSRAPIGGNGITAIATRGLAVGAEEAGAGAGVIVGGCSRYGIEVVDSTELRVVNSLLGANSAGTRSLSNTLSGVKVHLSTNAALAGTAMSSGSYVAGNTIAFNGGAGVEFTQDPGLDLVAAEVVHVLQHNQVQSNASDGIRLGTNVCSVMIGGTNLSAANQITRNGGSGISKVGTGERFFVEINSILSNAVKAIERTFDPQSQGAPQIISAIKGSTHVQGNVGGQPNQTVRLQFYGHRPKAGAQGEGEMWLGTVIVPLNGSGVGTYNAVLPRTAPSGWLVASTAADPVRGTSEFSTSQMVQLPTDTDGDGLPDFWEALYPSCLNPVVPDPPDEDCDGDGFTNPQEYIAHTDPTRADSALRVEDLLTDGAGATVNFTGVAGRQYGLERRTDLNTGSWVRVATAIPETDGPVSLSDPDPPLGSAYYQIVAEFP